MSTINKEMEQVATILRNAQQPQIKKALVHYGYTNHRFQEGQSLLNELQLLQQTQQEEYQSKGEVGRTLASYEREMRQQFVTHRALAKWIFRNDENGYQRLALFRPIASQTVARAAQIRHFYQEALKSHAMFARHGLTKAELEQGQNMIEAIMDARRERQQKAGEAQHATQQRDAVRQQMRIWLVDFRTVARIALREEPQLLEALGMTVTA